MFVTTTMRVAAAEDEAADEDDDERPSTALVARTPAVGAAVCSESVDRRSPRRWRLDRCRSPSCLLPSADCPRSSTRQGSTSTAASSHSHIHTHYFTCTFMCLVHPALLYLNVHVLKVFYEQINYYYYYYYFYYFEVCSHHHRTTTIT